MRRCLTLLAAGLLAAACTTFSTDDGPLPAPPVDAATRDASEADGATRDDAATDAGPRARFCESEPTHLLCEDFDEGTLAEGAWTEERAVVSGSATSAMAIGDAPYRSGPHALHVEMNSVVSGPLTNRIRHAVSAPASVHVVTFDVRVERLTLPTPATRVVLATIGDESSTVMLELFTTPSGLAFGLAAAATGEDRDAAPVSTYVFTNAPQSMVWMRVELSVDYVKGTALISLDGKPGKAETSAVSVPLSAAQAASVSLGVRSLANGTDAAIAFDNVTVDVK